MRLLAAIGSEKRKGKELPWTFYLKKRLPPAAFFMFRCDLLGRDG